MRLIFTQRAKQAEQARKHSTAAPAAWPQMSKILHPPRIKKLSERIKYRVRMLLCRNYIPVVLNSLDCYPEWHAMFQRRPYFYSSPMSLFVDRRLNRRQRFETMCTDLGLAHAKFGPIISQTLGDDRSVLLFAVDDLLSVHLSVNPINPKEGYWALTLTNAQGERIFNMTLAFLDAKTVLITSIQGGSNQMTNAKEIIQHLTKKSFGLRPHQLLLNVLQTACPHWGIERLWGIDPVNHIKGSWRRRRKQLKFDYRSFWLDMGSSEATRVNQHWAIPTTMQLKDVQDIESKKRSQYRQRYALLDTMKQSVAAALKNCVT
jgi:uncharacterized protein